MKKLLKRLRAAFKGFTVSGGQQFGWNSPALPVAGKRGPLWETSALAACIRFAVDTFPEAPLLIKKEGKDGEEWIKSHKAVDVVRYANPYYPGTNLFAATLLSLIVDGNAYWLKVRNRGSQVSELWYVPHWQIEPKWPLNGSEFISHYERQVGPRTERHEIEDVIHFRRGLDPSNTRKGWCTIKAALQEVLTDEECAVAARSIMKSLGMPGTIVSAKDKEVEITQEIMDQLKERWDTVKGEGRGGMIGLNIPVDVNMPQYDLEALAFEKVRGVSLERICADVGVDPLAVGLPSSNKTYSNYAEAREAAYENFLIPLQRCVSETLNLQLLPDIVSDRSLEYAFDLSKVRVLQDDENEKWTRIVSAYASGVIARSQAQGLLGVGEPDSGDVYIQDVSSGLGADQAALKAKIQLSKERRIALEASGVPDSGD